ncbi:MAG: hypothetical protein ABIH09_06310 [Candidatus Omnitrophota bacterium]
MKKTIFIVMFVSVTVLFCAEVFSQEQTDESTVFSQEGEDTDILPGMQAVSVGGAKVIIPKGAELKKVTPGLVVPQTAGEYIAQEMPAIKEKILQIQDEVDKMEGTEAKQDKQMQKKQSLQSTKGAEDEEDTQDTETPGILIAG